MDHAVTAALLDMSRASDSLTYWSTVSDYLNEFALSDTVRVMRRKDGIVDDNETTVFDSSDPQWRKYYQDKGFKYVDPLARVHELKDFGVFCWGSERVRKLHRPGTERLIKAMKQQADIAGGFGLHVEFPAEGYTISMAAAFRHDPAMVERRVTESAAMLEKFLTFAAVFHERMLAQDAPDGSYFDRLVVDLLLMNGLTLKEIDKFGLLAETEQKLDNPLTVRQREVLLKVAEGKSIKEIAHDLGITERVINYSLKQAKTRLGARNRTQAVLRASALGLLRPD